MVIGILPSSAVEANLSSFGIIIQKRSWDLSFRTEC
jgi:hypothetical protein